MPDGDEYFVGVDERLAPSQLPEGYVAGAKNMRFRDGKAATRLGVQICPWMKGAGRTPWDEVYGGAVFSNPNLTEEWFLIAADGGVWKTRPGMTATAVPLPPGVTLSAATFAQFVQCFNVLLLLRGPDAAPLVCTNLDEGFKLIVPDQEKLDAGLSPIPNSRFGLSYLNRLLLIQDKDTVAASDALDYTSYLPLQNSFRINEGTADPLVSIVPLGKGTLIMFKEQSVLQVTGATGDLSSAALDDVTTKYGCTAARSVVKSGADLYWLAESGIASLRLTEQNELQDTSQQLSDPLIRTFGRLNWQYAAGVVGEIWDGKLYMALPLDDATNTRMVPPPRIVYDGGGTLTYTGLMVGRTYRWTPGIHETQFTCGGSILVAAGDFVATGDLAIVSRPPPGQQLISYTGRLDLVVTGTNTGVVVYDFLNRAWCGVDEAEGVFAVKQFLKAKFNGRKRLFMLGADGVLRLYEEGFEDEVVAAVDTPYVDLLVNTAPGVGDSVSIDGRTAAVATADAVNGVNLWGCSTVELARTNLWDGYRLGDFQGNPPNTTVAQIDWGVRFTGIEPVVVTTGTWAYAVSHSGMELQCVPVVSEVVLRGMKCVDPDRKRFLALVLLLRTWNPSYTITAIVQGVNADQDYVTDATRSPVQYDVHSLPDWDPTNVNDDHGTPGREDYSVAFPDLGFNLGSGVELDAAQASTERVPVSEHGHFLQIKIVNSQGRLELVTALMEAQQGERQSGAHV